MTAAPVGERGMVPDDIGLLAGAGDPRLSPDGATVAYVVTTTDLEDNEYRSRIWLAATDGSSPPRPFSAGAQRDGRPRWSPDGQRLAFVSHREEKGSTLHVLAVTGGGELQTVATWPEEVGELVWSPDGEQLAFVARLRDEERYGKDKEKDQPPRRIDHLFYRHEGVGWTADRRRQLFIVPADGSARPRALTDGPYEHGGLSWSPDGAWLFVAAGRHDTWDLDLASDLFRVPVAGGALEQLTETGSDYALPSVSPDGRLVAFLWSETTSSPRHSQVGVHELDAARAAGPPRLLTTSLDRNCAPYPVPREPVWDGDAVVVGVEDAGNAHLYRAASDGSSGPMLLVGGDRMLSGWDVKGGVVAFCASSPTTPAELFVLGADGTERGLTHLGRHLCAAVTAVAPERFVAISPDGTEVEAWIIRPSGFAAGTRYPVLLNVHGGPFTQYGNSFFDEFQLQAGAGYAVVYANPRGSSGYSEAWGRAIRGPTATEEPGSGWGGVDYDDVMAVMDEALARFDFLDPDRLGMLGGSYGGYMATWIAGHTHRFKAICSERSVNNLLTLEQISDVASAFSRQIGVSHLDDPEEYRRQSPITYVRDIGTPLLIVHSEEDLRCPIAQAEELFIALRLLGKPVEFVRFPGESHELSRSGSPRHRIQRAEIILDFFARHLTPGP